MNEGTSTSASLITDTPAFEWGEGHPVRFALADLHTKGQFAAQTIVLIDSGFTQAIFGQQVEKQDECRIHRMQTLHVNNEKLTDDEDLMILQTYELAKADLLKIFVEPSEAFREARSTAQACIVYFPKIVQTNIGIDALTW